MALGARAGHEDALLTSSDDAFLTTTVEVPAPAESASAVADVVAEAPASAPAAPRSKALAQIRAASAAAAPAAVATPKSKRSTLVRDSLVVIRRAHLYAGLLMVPWVLLYGVTGILFNHPTWFSDQTIYTFAAEQAKGTALERLVTPQEIARSVVTALSAKTGESYQFVEREGARFERGGLSATLMVDGKPFSASVDPTEGTGQIREGLGGRGGGGGGAAPRGGMTGAGGPGAPQAVLASAGGPNSEGTGAGGEMRGRRGGGEGRGGPGAEGEGEGGRRGGGEGRGGRGGMRGEGGPRGGAGMGSLAAVADPNDPFAAVGPVAVEPPVLDQMKASLPTIASRVGIPGKVEVTQVRASMLSFLITGADKTWRATYDLASGTLSGQPNTTGAGTQGADLSTRRFLLRLHMAHGYPSEFNARWVWAVIVDVMSSLMIFWGVSGLVMWWQIKRTRRIGGGVLALSALMALWVFVEMHQEMLGLVR